MRLMSDIREAAWGVVQGGLSDLDFDFAGYAERHFARLRGGCPERRGRTMARRGGRGLGGQAAGAARTGADRDHRRRRRRRLDRLPPRAAGERDVVLLDRNELTSGSTFHSAGLVGQLRSSLPLTRMMMDSVELYRQLDCGWVECGGIRLACTPEREEEVLRQVAWARTFGLPLELISPEAGAGAVPADGHGRACGAAPTWRPTATWTPRC